MGKDQKKRAMRRHNPIARRVSDTSMPLGPATPEQSLKKMDVVPPIIQKLDSSEPEERVWACAAVSNLITDDPSTRRLLQGKNVVGKLIHRLSDHAAEVVVEALGALRNIAVDGGHDVCSEMFNKGLLIPLNSCIERVSSTFEAHIGVPSDTESDARRLTIETAENVMALVSMLSEASHKALAGINQYHWIPFFMSFILKREQVPLPTTIAAAQCLYVLSGDNDPVIEIIRAHSEYTIALIRLAQEDSLSSNAMNVDLPLATDSRLENLRLLTCGIIRNILPLPTILQFDTSNLVRSHILPKIFLTISVSLPDIIKQASEMSVPHWSKHGSQPLLKSNITSVEQNLPSVELQLTNVELSLEILTDIAAVVPNGTAQDFQISVEEDMDIEIFDPAGCDDRLPIGTSEHLYFLLKNFTTPLIKLAEPTVMSFLPPDADSTHPVLTSLLESIHIRALECLNNMFLGLGIIVTPDYESGTAISDNDLRDAAALWSRLWSMFNLVNSRLKDRHPEFRHASVGVLWGLSRVCSGKIVAGQEEVDILIKLCNDANEDIMRVKCIGILENLAMESSSVEINRNIGAYLLHFIRNMEVAYPESIIQAVSSMIDIYSDESMPYDINFRNQGWLKELCDVQGPVKKLIRGIDRQKKGNYELQRRAAETLTNLKGFIAYRKRLNF